MGFVEDVARLRRVQPGSVRMGTVVSIPTPAEALAMVLLAGGEVPAYFTSDHLWFDPGTGPQSTVAVGVKVTLLRLDGSWQIIATHSGSGGLMGGPVLGTELLPNNGFEYGAVEPSLWDAWPWVAGNWDMRRDTTPGESVSGSARVLVTLSPDASVAPAVRVWTLGAITVDAGETYQMSAWVKASSLDAALTVQLGFISAANPDDAQVLQPLGTEQAGAVVVSPGAAYQFLTTPFTVPAGHSYARAFLRAESTDPATNLTVSWDEASLRQRITA